MRITLIGGAGVVGQSLIPYLGQRHEIRVLDLHPVPPRFNVESLVGDVLDPGALGSAIRGADAIVYLAAVVPKQLSAQHPRTRRAFEVNVYGLFSALSSAVDHTVPRFVHVSSLSVFREYGKVPVDTSRPPDATNPYGMSKLLAEQTCATIAAANPGMSVTSLRLAVPTTEELWPLWRSPSTPDAEPERIRFGDVEVAALHPSDLAAAMEWALERDGAYLRLAVTGDLHGVTFAGPRGWVPRFGGDTDGMGRPQTELGVDQ